MSGFLARWQRAVERRDAVAANGGQPTEEETTMPTATDEELPDCATITREGNRVTLTVELPADVVLNSVSEYAIRMQLIEAAAWVEYVPERQRQRQTDRSEA